MFGFLPSWAVGVIAIMLGIGVVKVFTRAAYNLLGIPQPPHEGRGRRRAMIGMDARVPDAGERAAELDDLQRRVAELEERLDFAERLLAQQRDAGQINPPGR